MQKSNILIFMFTLILVAQNVSASALVGPSCFVTAKVVEIGSEMIQLDSGRDYERNYLNIEILIVDSGDDCPVQQSQVFKAIDNYPGTFQKGDRIKAGIAPASSLGPSGGVSFLQWSDLTYENGDDIPSKYNNAIIDLLQSDAEPLVIDQVEDTEQEDIPKEDNNYGNKNNINYFYFVIPLLIVVGFLLYRLLHKRSVS